jgi:hypothetical protein
MGILFYFSHRDVSRRMFRVFIKPDTGVWGSGDFKEAFHMVQEASPAQD